MVPTPRPSNGQLNLQFLEAAEYSVEPGSSVELGNADYHAFAFVTRGSVHVRLPQQAHTLTAKISYGELVYLPDHTILTLQNADKQTAQLIVIRFTAEGRPASSVQAWFGQRAARTLQRIRMPRVYGWVQELVNESKDRPSGPFLIQSYLYAMMAEMTDAAASPKADNELIDYVIQVKNSMLEQYQADLDMEELARLSGASKARFYELFRTYTGLSPLKFITTVRLKESLRLLSSQALTVTEAAHAVGYADELYFSRLFKKHFGISPTEFVTAAKLRIACLTPVFTGDFSALGITPVVTLPRGWAEGDRSEAYMRSIEQCSPQQIYTSPIPEDLQRRLAELAPVIVMEWKGYPWKERLRDISRGVGLSVLMERWLDYFHKKVDNARSLTLKRLGGEPFLVVSVYPSLYRVYGMQRRKIQDLFYGDLGVTPPAALTDISFLDTPSLETIAELDCSRVIFLLPQSAPDDEWMRLEKEWHQVQRKQPAKPCMFLRHEDPLLYNASFYDSLVDAYVDALMSYRL
ncbi:helix-turn-helix domain-containing protein [Paenibacillus chartarius]|uniref:Helix-turn-helix domain-containing protein n=1 Tax=Paenibacillus chartarius TaxID=747481 RepID=A0ABV6DU42_9BACL